jgi:ATP-dependent 26S proteasome regulatory subunit
VEVPNVSWEDIGGLDNVKRELQEVFHSVIFPLNLFLNGQKIAIYGNPSVWLGIELAVDDL